MPRQFRSDDTSIWQEGFGNGRDGSLTISNQDTTFYPNQTGYSNYNVNAYGLITGTSGQTTATVTDAYGFWTDYVRSGDVVLIHQTRSSSFGYWELNVIMSGIPASSSSSTGIFKYPLQNTYTTGAQIVKVPQLSSMTVNSGIRVYSYPFGSTTNSGGIMAVMVNGTFTNNGEIWLDGRGFRRGGSTGGINQGTDGFRAEGPTVDYLSSRGTTRDYMSAGGGRQGANGIIPGAGSGGGHAGNGTTGGSGETGVVAEQGLGYGTGDLTNMNFGGGGGAGGGRVNVTTQGGSGGGILVVIAKTFVNNGYILSRGQNGDNGNAGANYTPAGGGGAGGSILVKAETATLGTNLVYATGGTGGTGYTGQYGSQVGGNGANGRIHLDYKTSYTGATSPTIDVTQDSSLVNRLSGGSFFFNIL